MAMQFHYERILQNEEVDTAEEKHFSLPYEKVSAREKWARGVVSTLAGIGSGSVVGIATGLCAGLGIGVLSVAALIGWAVTLPLSIIFGIYVYANFSKDDIELENQFRVFFSKTEESREMFDKKYEIYKKKWEEEMKNSFPHRYNTANDYLSNAIAKGVDFGTLLNDYLGPPRPAYFTAHQHQREESAQSRILHHRNLGPLMSFLGTSLLGCGLYASSVLFLGAAIPPLGIGLAIIGAGLFIAASVAYFHRYTITKSEEREAKVKDYEHNNYEKAHQKAMKLNELSDKMANFTRQEAMPIFSYPLRANTEEQKRMKKQKINDNTSENWWVKSIG